MSEEVRAGYKLTEVGVIPEDWMVRSLDRISPRQSVGLVINPSTYFDKAGTVPLLVGSNVSENRIDWATANRITEASNDLLQASRLTAGDLVTVRVGEPGVTAVVPPELDGCNCASMMIVRQHASFDSHWLCCMMNSQHGRGQVEHVQYGTAQKQFNISDAVDFLYPVPPLPEQRAIAAALSDVDALLEGLTRLIAKKRDLKQAAMQQLLTGQTRLPGFSGAWEVKRLGDLAEVVMGQSPSSSNYNSKGDGLPLIQGNADIANRQTIRRIFTTQITKRGKAGDILMSVRAPVGEISRATFDVCLGRGVCAIRFPNDFLYHCLIFFEPNWAKHSKGSTFDSVSSADVNAVEIQVPTDATEQSAIATVLSDMDAELAALEARRDKTRALKQAMMRELLTGKTRLVSPEVAHA